jgi:hypothetical protein
MKKSMKATVEKTRKSHTSWPKSMSELFGYTHNYVNMLNNSKLFAGLMIIILNIASKFVTIKLSKSMEAYLKYTFSRQILVFAIAWMGTRDIYIAITITIVFVFLMDFLFNEESRFCILPEAFTDYHVNLLETNTVNNLNPSPTTNTGTPAPTNSPITSEEIEQAKALLERAKQQGLSSSNASMSDNSASFLPR